MDFFLYPYHPITDEETEAQVGHVEGESQDWEPDTGPLDSQAPVLLALHTSDISNAWSTKTYQNSSWLLVRNKKIFLGKHAGEAD